MGEMRKIQTTTAISSQGKTSNPFNMTQPFIREKKKNFHLKISTKMMFYHILTLTQSACFKVREPLSENTIQPSPKETYFRKLKGKVTLVYLRNFKIK